jgi:hypothetical protein
MAGGEGPGVLTDAGPTPVPQSGTSRLIQSVRIVLVALALVAAGAVLWQHPRTGTIAGLRHDLVSGRATNVEIVTSSGSEISVGKPWQVPDRTPTIPYVRWVTSDHRVHDAPIGSGGFSDPYDDSVTPGYDGVAHSQLLPRGARKDLAAWMDGRNEARVGHVSVNLLPLFSLVCIVLLVGGPPTRRGTKWAWFWFSGMAPLGLGILAWLAFETPWSRTLTRTPEEQLLGPTSLARRRHGWAGFGWGLVVAIAAQALFWVSAGIL